MSPAAGSSTYPACSGRVHGFTALLGMLRTVERNISAGPKQFVDPGTTALNPNFPVSGIARLSPAPENSCRRSLWSSTAICAGRKRRDLAGGRVRLGVGSLPSRSQFPGRAPDAAQEAAGRRVHREFVKEALAMKCRWPRRCETCHRAQATDALSRRRPILGHVRPLSAS